MADHPEMADMYSDPRPHVRPRQRTFKLIELNYRHWSPRVSPVPGHPGFNVQGSMEQAPNCYSRVYGNPQALPRLLFLNLNGVVRAVRGQYGSPEDINDAALPWPDWQRALANVVLDANGNQIFEVVIWRDMGSIGWEHARHRDRTWELEWVHRHVAGLQQLGVSFTFLGSPGGWDRQDRSTHSAVSYGLWPLYLRMRADRHPAAAPPPPAIAFQDCIFVCYFLGEEVCGPMDGYRDAEFMESVDAFEGRRRPWPPGPRPHPHVWTPQRLMGLEEGDYAHMFWLNDPEEG